MNGTVAYCGLVCQVCRWKHEGDCKETELGCRSGGGLKNCYRRRCCLDKGIDGCWQCENYPCEHLEKGEHRKVWKGLDTAFNQCIREMGKDDFVSLVESRLGKTIDYGDFRFKTKQEILTILCGMEE